MDSSPPPSVVCFGEVLWDILPTGALPGGAPMNVAYHLKQLAETPALITKIGKDSYGKDLLQMLAASGLNGNYVAVDEEQPTGLVYANISNQHEVTYDIVYPSAWDFIEGNVAFTDLLQSAAYLVYGSLASRHVVARTTLMNLLDTAVTKVLDINLRPPYYNRNHLEYLLHKAHILKMNRDELELVTGWWGGHMSVEDGIKKVQDTFDIETVIVTMGGDGAVVAGRGTMHRHAGFPVSVADTIGSGDAFLAGYLHKLLQGATIKEALLFAAGLGAFIATKRRLPTLSA